MKALHMIAWILVIVGGLNWGIYALTGGSWEVGHLLGGMNSMVSKIVYILVGLAALYELFTHSKRCKECSSSAGNNMPKM